MRWIGAALVVAVAVLTGGVVLLAAPTVAAFVAAMAQAVIIFVYVCICLVALWGVVGAWWWVTRTKHEQNRQRDGAFAVREYWLEGRLRRMVNGIVGRVSVRAVIDVNTLLTHGAIISQYGVVPLAPAGGDMAAQLEQNKAVEITRRAQAVTPGDNVLGNPLVSVQAGNAPKLNAAAARLAAGYYDPRPRVSRVDRPIVDESHQLPAPAPADVSLGDGLHQGDAQNWPLGFAADGTLATFAPLRHAHAGIVGATGTGKTSSVGYLLAAHALRHGWHVVILDADNGNAWTPFAAHAEHVESDAETLPDQMAALYGEFQRRARLLADNGAADMLAMPDAPPRVLAVIEEYGDLRHTLGLRSPKAADTVDGQLDTILRRGRKAGVHVALLDQYPEHWSQQVLAGVKWLAVFRLGPNQGSKVEEYKAHQLPQRGAFLVHGTQYNAWHTAPVVSQLLADVPAMPTGARLLGGAGVRAGTFAGGGVGVFAVSGTNSATNSPVNGTMNNVIDATNTTTNTEPPPMTRDTWREWALDYMARTPSLWETPPRGVRQMARDMSEYATGDTLSESSYVGMASELCKDIRSEARLPGGDRLGTDITGSAI